MRRAAVPALWILLASILPVIVFAGTPDSNDRVPLGEDDFLAAALGRADVLRSLSEEVGERRADVVSAGILDNPVLSWSREDVDGPGLEQEAVVSWRPPRPDRRRLELAAARSLVASAEARRQTALLDLRRELRSVYARWALSRARADVLAEEAEIFRELVRRTRARHASGETSGWELRRLRLAESEVTSRLESLRAAARLAGAEARAWHDRAGDDVEPVVPDLPPVPSSGDLSSGDLSSGEDVSEDIEGHPRLVALRSELRAAELAERAAKKFVEMPALTAGWKREESGDVALEGPVLGLSWPLPLSERGQGSRARAATRRQALDARLELLRRRLVAELAAARATYADLRSAAFEAEERARDGPPATEAALRAYHLGEADFTDLLATIRSVTAARLAALDLRAEALAAHRRLERLAPESRGTQE